MNNKSIMINTRAKCILDDLVEKIITGDFIDYVKNSIELFNDGCDIPCMKWSKLNKILTYYSNTADARGIKQWREAGRSIKKGSNAFYIFVPMFKKIKEPSETEEKILSGFHLMPVFRFEDTEGKELEYQHKMKKLDVENLPLIEVAKSLDVMVKAGICEKAAGSYRPFSKVITLNTLNQQVFLHELSHAVDYHLGNYDKDYGFGEIVAELSSAFLGSLYGIPIDLKNTKAYIQNWSGKGHVAFRVTSAIARVEEIYKFIEQFEITQRKERAMNRKSTNKEQSTNLVLPFKTNAIKERTQMYNPHTGKWVKRDSKTGLFTAVKKDGKPWNRVEKEIEPIASRSIFDRGDYFPAA